MTTSTGGSHEIRHAFERAVSFLESGDIAGLRQLLGEDPGLATARQVDGATLRYRHELTGVVDLFRRRTGAEFPTRPRLGRAAPVLSVEDLERSFGFYRDSLGFAVTFEQRDDRGELVYGIVDCGGSEIHLARRSRWLPEPGACHIFVDPAAELYREFQAAGVEFEQEPTAKPWGLEDFVISDPDGNRLEIGGPIPRHEKPAGDESAAVSSGP